MTPSAQISAQRVVPEDSSQQKDDMNFLIASSIIPCNMITTYLHTDNGSNRDDKLADTCREGVSKSEADTCREGVSYIRAY